jgi:hypothetical protein
VRLGSGLFTLQSRVDDSTDLEYVRQGGILHQVYGSGSRRAGRSKRVSYRSPGPTWGKSGSLGRTYDRVVFGDLPIRGVLIFAAIGMLACLGYSAASNTLSGTRPVAVVTGPSRAPVVVATNPPTPAPPSEAQRTATPSPLRPIEPAATPQGSWFWVKEVTGSDEGSAESDNLAIEVTSAQFGALTASTASHATCVATGTYPSGAPIVSGGLGQTSADASGFVRWKFTASPAERGRASYLFTCFTGSGRRSLEVLFDIP